MRALLAALFSLFCLSASADMYIPPQLSSTNKLEFDVKAKLTAAVPVCQVQGCTATGSGYGNALTGTIWLTSANGFTCSTYPVLNVTTNAGGNITTVNSVATQGVVYGARRSGE